MNAVVRDPGLKRTVEMLTAHVDTASTLRSDALVDPDVLQAVHALAGRLEEAKAMAKRAGCARSLYLLALLERELAVVVGRPKAVA